MMLYIGFIMVTQKLRYDKRAVFVIVLAVIILIFKFVLGQNYIKKVLLLLFIPMLMSICFENLTKKDLKLLFRVVVILYIFQCGLSIAEWTLNRNFFEMNVPIDNEFWMKMGFFRSTALFGHPLENAQIVAVFMAFIAVSEFKRKSFQIFLFFLGYVSLFCFNARGATMVVTVFTVPYLIWKINNSTPPNKRWIIKLGIFVMCCGMFYMVTQTTLGGRLMNMDLMDGSAKTRVQVFQFHKFYQSHDDFLWGHSDLYYYMTLKLGAGGVENGVVAMILDYGIIFTIPLLLLLFIFQYNKLSVYSNLERWILLAVFFLIGSMNPNLKMPIQWTMWVFAYYAFRPELFDPQTQTISSENPELINQTHT